MKKILLIVSLLLSPYISWAGEGAGSFKVLRVLLWSDGSFKIYTDSASINGLQGCTATDKTIGVPATNQAKNQMLSMVLTAKTSGSYMSSWVNDCCMTHNGLTSPCVNTISIEQ